MVLIRTIEALNLAVCSGGSWLVTANEATLRLFEVAVWLFII